MPYEVKRLYGEGSFMSPFLRLFPKRVLIRREFLFKVTVFRDLAFSIPKTEGETAGKALSVRLFRVVTV